MHTVTTNSAPAYFYNNLLLDVEYSFSEYPPDNRFITSNKLWLDILFMHPENEKSVTIRVAKPTFILCQANEVIEAIVHREIRNFLQQNDLNDYHLNEAAVA